MKLIYAAVHNITISYRNEKIALHFAKICQLTSNLLIEITNFKLTILPDDYLSTDRKEDTIFNLK